MTSEITTILSPMEIDVIGEVMNISMGSGATAMSTVLDAKVNITTPRIEVVNIDDFDFSYLEPVIGVSIKYIEGIDGTNVLLLKEEDLKKILCHLLSMEDPDEITFDEISTSAICEIMNQMMGSSASALAQFLGKPINISPPEIMETNVNEKTTKEVFQVQSDQIVSIKFDLIIDGIIESEFMSVMEPSLVREIVTMTMGGGMEDIDLSGVEAAQEPAPAAPVVPEPAMAAPEPAMAAPAAPTQTAPLDMQAQASSPAPSPAPSPAAAPTYIQPIQAAPMAQDAMQSQGMYGQPMYQQPMYQQPMYQQPMQQQMTPQMVPHQQPQAQPVTPVNAVPYTYKQLGDAVGIDLTDSNNLELVMSVPIQITVELGTTKKKIKDIIELCQGNIVELDRQAGDQVDILANGRLIAKGDVVVVDDNYSVRVTEIIKRDGNNLF